MKGMRTVGYLVTPEKVSMGVIAHAVSMFLEGASCMPCLHLWHVHTPSCLQEIFS